MPHLSKATEKICLLTDILIFDRIVSKYQSMWFPLAGKDIHCTTFFDSFPRQIAQQSRSRLHDNTFTELLQPFGFLPHNILIAKLYEFILSLI